jgi:hypothetical protein
MALQVFDCTDCISTQRKTPIGQLLRTGYWVV